VLDELIISNEVIEEQATAKPVKQVDSAAKRRRSVFHAYVLLGAAILFGYLIRENRIVDPSEGVGYWLGIVGALGILGSVRNWFRLHIFFGLFGPLLILYHCNFTLGSFNSRVALYSMLVVAGSGIVGFHIYARIHRGLNGKKSNLLDLQKDLTETMDANHGLATLMPNLVCSLEVLSAELQGDAITQSIGIGRSLKWTVKQGLYRFKLKRIARKELNERAAESPVIARDLKRLRRAANQHINGYVRKMGRVAQFSLYERLFSMWHVFHLPLFLMLVLSASVHVLAVHMY